MRRLWILCVLGLGAGCSPSADDLDLPPVATCPTRDLGCVTVAWAGDTLLADAALPLLEEQGYDAPFEYVGGLLDVDLAIGNAEGPITTDTTHYNPSQTWAYNAEPEAAAALARVGFDALSLANNHLWDRGPVGLEDTLQHLDEAGVVAFGGGLERADALAPFLVETPGGLVAVFGFGRPSGIVPAATPTQMGQLVLDAGNALDAVALADELEALPVAFVHWGQNYADVNAEQRAQADVLVGAGFQLIVGHGSHNQQDVGFVDGVPVLWSLGNFVFGTPGRWDEDFPGYGLVAWTRFGEDGLEGIDLHCIVTDNGRVQYQPERCEPDEAVDVLEGLGEDVVVEDGVGVVVL